MFESNPIRRRAVHLAGEAIAGTIVSFCTLFIMTGLVLVAAFQIGPDVAGYALSALFTLAVVFGQHGVWSDLTDDDGGLPAVGWLGNGMIGLLFVLYFNGIVLAGTTLGNVVGAPFGALVVVLYVLADTQSPRYGWPISLTSGLSLALYLGFRLADVLGELTWQDFDPADVLLAALGRRSNSR